jgi:hypothetical protein
MPGTPPGLRGVFASVVECGHNREGLHVPSPHRVRELAATHPHLVSASTVGRPPRSASVKKVAGPVSRARSSDGCNRLLIDGRPAADMHAI